MRTAQQINNLKIVLIQMYGPFAMFMSDEDVNKWADKVQEHVNQIKSWKIKIRGEINNYAQWAQIEPEPKTHSCTKEVIEASCYQLLIKYPSIETILVINSNNETEQFYVSRD